MLTSRFGVPHATPSGISMSALFNPGARFRRMNRKTRTDGDGKVEKGWDHDPPAKTNLVPIGILMVATGALRLLFGSHETSDAWVDALQIWWLPVRADLGPIKRLVSSLDNGPKNFGRRTQFLKRRVQFADWSNLAIHWVYYPPYHSKYNPIERCWSALEKKLHFAKIETIRRRSTPRFSVIPGPCWTIMPSRGPDWFIGRSGDP